jgi:hypothetical protein
LKALLHVTGDGHRTEDGPQASYCGRKTYGLRDDLIG